VAVLARVRDAKAWAASPDFRQGVVVGPAADGGWIVTGRAPLARVERLFTDRNALAIEPAIPLTPLLDEATLELAAQPGLIAGAAAEQLGAGALVGMVDSSLDYAHDNLRDATGRPRVVAAWQQGAPRRNDSRADYGAIWDRRELSLSTGNASRHDSHAARMLDMAAGNGRSSGAPGVAPRAEIVHVDLTSRRGASPHTLGDTVRLVEGMQFIFGVAKSTPCAVSVSLGTSAGSHDGNTLVEQALDLLATAAPNRAIVVAAGNGYAAEQHASGVIQPSEACELGWHVPAVGRKRHSIEIWYSAGDEFEVELAAPRGLGGCRAAADSNCRLVDASTGKTVALVAHEASRDGGDRVATVFLERAAPAGIWTLRLKARRVVDGRFHAWIVPEDPIRPVFLSHVDVACTLSALACGRHTIAVGAYDAARPQLPMAWYSSAGPTRDGRPKPGVSAPGHRVWVARAGRTESAVESSGTSLAAAAGAGVAALVLAQAASHGLLLSADELQRILTETARLHPPAGVWDDRYGYGRLDAATALFLVEQIATLRNGGAVTTAAT